MKIVTQRIYDDGKQKGYRVLIDRLWPRGISKEAALLDEWCKDIAPSTALRKWFGHKAENWQEFRRRYLLELRHNEENVRALRMRAAAEGTTLVLLFGTKKEELSHAQVLKEYILELIEEEETRHCASPPCSAHEL